MTRKIAFTFVGAALLALATSPVLAQLPSSNEEPLPKIPVGFTSIFNGQNLDGWHISRTNHHGTTPDYHVMHGMIVGSQNPVGQGGILLTDKKYKNVEVYMEIKPDWGCDGGIFLHSNEAGDAYQVMLDYLPGGTMVAGVYGEGISGVSMNANPRGGGAARGGGTVTPEQRQAQQAQVREAVDLLWKREAWNEVRARIEGNPPTITTYLNGEMMFRGTDTENHAADGAEDGFIAIQIHGGNRCRPGSFWRWRTIAVKELPDE